MDASLVLELRKLADEFDDTEMQMWCKCAMFSVLQSSNDYTLAESDEEEVRPQSRRRKF